MVTQPTISPSCSRGEADPRRCGSTAIVSPVPLRETLFDFWPGFVLRILLRVFLRGNPEIVFANTRSPGRLNGHAKWAE
jgi:hypothetical protein